MNLEKMNLLNNHDLRQIVVAYWQEVMPQSEMMQNPARQEAYFLERFLSIDDNLHLYWAVVAGQKVGFVAYTVDDVKKSASINDFFVVPEVRRCGYGTAMVQAVYEQLDRLGVELVELNVRRDNPQALAFWEAQGFRIALYRLRQYRDPKRGQSYIGALSSDFT